MKDSFKFKSRSGTTIYTAVKITDDSAGDPNYLVSWGDEGISDGGSRPYKEGTIKRHLDEGIWVLVESPEDLFSQELASENGSWTLGTDGSLSVNIDAKGICTGMGLGVSTQQLQESLTEKYGTLQDFGSQVGEFIEKRHRELGVARPILETRKIGKDGMHMVNDGFPLALRHLAQIMTWAAEVKQYKLHDWRNLPNADVEFPSAEGRHANDNSIQKAEGLSALERVDHESGKLHIGHKVFNALCELELILSGKIK